MGGRGGVSKGKRKARRKDRKNKGKIGRLGTGREMNNDQGVKGQIGGRKTMK